jgi:hypothetical protein
VRTYETQTNVERGDIGDSFSGAAWPGATRTLCQ